MAEWSESACKPCIRDPQRFAAAQEGQSEWNKGGWAFEERDLTAFCKQRLGHLAGQIVCTDGVVIHFSNVSGVIGHALVTFRQGRKRAGVNWDQVG